MRVVKIIFLVLAALYTISAFVRLILSAGPALRGASSGNSYEFGYFMGGIFAVVIGAAVTMTLWKSLKNSAPPRDDISNRPPIPEVPQKERHE